jgi:hypothetical protein
LGGAAGANPPNGFAQARVTTNKTRIEKRKFDFLNMDTSYVNIGLTQDQKNCREFRKFAAILFAEIREIRG